MHFKHLFQFIRSNLRPFIDKNEEPVMVFAIRLNPAEQHCLGRTLLQQRKSALQHLLWTEILRHQEAILTMKPVTYADLAYTNVRKGVNEQGRTGNAAIEGGLELSVRHQAAAAVGEEQGHIIIREAFHLRTDEHHLAAEERKSRQLIHLEKLRVAEAKMTVHPHQKRLIAHVLTEQLTVDEDLALADVAVCRCRVQGFRFKV